MAGNRFLTGLTATYAAIFVAAAIAPHDRQDWLLENLIVVPFLALLAGTYRRFAFSNASYVLIFLFMALHAVGSHYTYSNTPLGFWLQQSFGMPRNPYDRVVHFAFGVLLTYPAYELTVRHMRVAGGFRFVVPVMAIVSLSASYEIIESWAARVVAPELGITFLGTQGDEWDAQKDMTLALVGSLIAIAATALSPLRKPSTSRRKGPP